MRGKVRSYSIVLAMMLAAVGGLLRYQNVVADPPSAVGDSTPASPTSSCTNILSFLNDGSYHRCSRLGVGWFYESKDPAVSTVNITGPGATSLSCPGIDGYYRLSYIYAAVEGTASNPQIVYKGSGSYEYAGALNVSLGLSPNTIRKEDRNALTWAEANAAFLIAQSMGVTRTTWEGTAAFCFDSSWDCPEGEICEPEPEPEVGESNGYFWSISSVEAVSSGDVPAGIEAETDQDGEAEIRFSTDQASVELKFTHYMGYTNTTNYGANDVVADAETKWTVYQANNNQTLGNSIEADQTFKADNGKTKTTTSVKDEPIVTVNLAPGETKTVCQTIKYSPKYIKYTKTSHAATLTAAAYDEYTNPVDAGNPSSGKSNVCATVTRPSLPDSGDGAGGTGSTGSDIMYAGETADISWDVSGGNVDTRRLRAWQAVVYRVPVNVGYSSRWHTGTTGPLYGQQPNAVCNWYRVSGYDYCDVIGGRSGSFGEEGEPHSYNEEATIVVPDTVGYKYCNSFGYYYEYWWYSSSAGGWHQDKSYWRVHDASCRTIAKKPSVAVWNGSFFTLGSIKTLASPRFNNAEMGKETREVSGKTLYGSWVEYLAEVKNVVTYFGSGSSFARGSNNTSAPRSDPLDTSNSSLTIANRGKLGDSGIYNNSTYRIRLSTFLENRATILNDDTLSAMVGINSTQIWRRNGSLKLTGNITVQPSGYDNIYQLPQVVIFVHGDLEITSEVTQIDAWLVVDGTIYTCSDFSSGNTEADAVNRDSNQCSRQLVFNGPVLAGAVVLNRSFGSDPLVRRTGTFGDGPAKYNAAEVFNLRTDAYLWALAQASRYASSYTESYSRELPPRY